MKNTLIIKLITILIWNINVSYILKTLVLSRFECLLAPGADYLERMLGNGLNNDLKIKQSLAPHNIFLRIPYFLSRNFCGLFRLNLR